LPRPGDYSDYNSWYQIYRDNSPYKGGNYRDLLPYYEIAPRVFGDEPGTSNRGISSRGGTQYTVRNSPRPQPVGRRITPDADRLYASGDELLFQPDRELTAGRSAEAWGDLMEDASFFLTANSRAPETTLFNTPKIAMYPIQEQSRDRFLKEDYLRFVSEINGDLYAFQRRNLGMRNKSRNTDASFLYSEGPKSDIGLERNGEMLGYLERMMATSIPGVGASFADKWDSNNADKVALYMFDQIRSTIASSDIRSVGVDGRGLQRVYSAGTNFNYAMSSTRNGQKGLANQVTFIGATIIFGATDTLGYSDRAEILTTSKMQAILLLHPFTPYLGGNKSSHGFRFRVRGASGLSITAAETSSMLDGVVDATYRVYPNNPEKNDGTTVQKRGVYDNFLNSLDALVGPDVGGKNAHRTRGGSDPVRHYPLVTEEINVDTTGGPGAATFNFSGGAITVEVLDKSDNVVQTIQMDFPALENVAVPQALSSGSEAARRLDEYVPGRADDRRLGTSYHPLGDMLETRPRRGGHSFGGNGSIAATGDIVRGVHWVGDSNSHGDPRLLAARSNIPRSEFAAHPRYSETTGLAQTNTNAKIPQNERDRVLDNRRATAMRFDLFTLGGGYTRPNWNRKAHRQSGSDTGQVGGSQTGTVGISAGLSRAGEVGDNAFGYWKPPVTGYGGVAAEGGGDWSEGMGIRTGGGFMSPASAGNMLAGGGGFYTKASGDIEELGSDEFEPTKAAMSPLLFGSLPVPGELGWTTLLFNPRPFQGSSHPGFDKPADHLLLDFFWLPIVEPYPISERMSTAGKVNLNYQMWPFPYIERSTAIRGVMKPVPISVIKDHESRIAKTNAAPNSRSVPKQWDRGGNPPAAVPGTHFGTEVRNALRLDAAQGDISQSRQDSLEDFRRRFNNGEVFRTASEICEVSLVEDGESYAGLNSYWGNADLTSDTMRELPYMSIYPRVTTKSNTYTVHYRVQSLGHPATEAKGGLWVEREGRVLGEFRGQASIERYIDPNDSSIPDYATSDPDSVKPLGDFYQWRVVKKSRFAPEPEF